MSALSIESSASPWQWDEGLHRFALVSPCFAPSDPTSLAEHGSFLPSFDTFTLEDEGGTSASGCCAETSAPANPTSPARGKTLTEHTGASDGEMLPPRRSKDLESMIQSAWDDVDAALEHKDQSMLSPQAPTFWPPDAAHPARSPPNAEEQAWLEAQCTAMEEVAQEEAAEVAMHEAEDAWVQRMLHQHPKLDREEAHRMWRAGADQAC